MVCSILMVSVVFWAPDKLAGSSVRQRLLQVKGRVPDRSLHCQLHCERMEPCTPAGQTTAPTCWALDFPKMARNGSCSMTLFNCTTSSHILGFVRIRQSSAHASSTIRPASQSALSRLQFDMSYIQSCG